MAIDEVKNMFMDKVDKLTEAVALLVQAIANKENRPRSNHQSEESNDSESEYEEPSPPPKKNKEEEESHASTHPYRPYQRKAFKMDWVY